MHSAIQQQRPDVQGIMVPCAGNAAGRRGAARVAHLGELLVHRRGPLQQLLPQVALHGVALLLIAQGLDLAWGAGGSACG